MPQSIQIVPKYSYPYVETVINDNTKVSDDVSTTRVDPIVTYVFPFVSSKGIDNKFVRKTSYNSFVSTYGNSNYKKYGQPIMMPLALLQKTNTYVWCMRVMPENATYSNNVISLYYKADAIADNVKASERKFRIKFTQKSLSGVKTIDEYKEQLNLLDGQADATGKYVDDEGYTQAPIMGIRSTGRGKYGDNYSIRVSQNSAYEKEYGIKMYNFEVLNNEGGLNKIATYVGSSVSSSKYDATTLITDILDNANDGDLPVYINMNEDNIEDVYDAYVAFLEEQNPLLEAEYDETFAKYVELFAEYVTETSLKLMVSGTDKVPSTVSVTDEDDNEIKLTDAVAELQALKTLISETTTENIVDIDEFDPFFANKVDSTSTLPCITFPSELPKTGVPAGADAADYTSTKLMPVFGSVKGVVLSGGDDGYFANPRVTDANGEILTQSTATTDENGNVVTSREVEVADTVEQTRYVDSSDDSYYVSTGTAEAPAYKHYDSDGTEVAGTVTATETRYVDSTDDSYYVSIGTAEAPEYKHYDSDGTEVAGTVTATETRYVDSTDDSYYVSTGTTEAPAYKHFNSDGTEITETVDANEVATKIADETLTTTVVDLIAARVTAGTLTTTVVDLIAARVTAGTLTTTVVEVETSDTHTVTKYYLEDGTEVTGEVITGATIYTYSDGTVCTSDVKQWTLQEEIDECYINAFSGVYDRRILSARRIPVLAFFDANYSFNVKKVLVDLAVTRNDAPVYLDAGIDVQSFSAANIKTLVNDYSIFDSCLVIKNLQHFKIRETPSQKRVTVSITYFLAQNFADHYMDYGTHIPMVKSKAQLSGHIRDSIEPSIEDYEADLKETLYKNNFNYFETLDDNVFQRATQTTSQSDMTDLSEENNVFTLYEIKRIVESDIHDELYDFADASTRERFTAYEQAKFANWVGSKVLSFDIVFDVNEWEFDHSILHCYISVVFRGLQKRAILEIDINKRVYGETSSDDDTSTTGTVVL